MKWQMHIDRLSYSGNLTEEDAKQVQAIFIKALGEDAILCDKIAFYWLVDPFDGFIIDARFSAFGGPELLGIGNAVVSTLINKSYAYAKCMDAAFLEKHCGASSQAVLVALERGLELCSHIPTMENTSPVFSSDVEKRKYPGWALLSKEKQVAVITEVIDVEIAPYIALDAGGVRVLDLIDGLEVRIGYEGACVACPSSTGATLDAIQQILQAKVHDELRVVPDLSFFASTSQETNQEPEGL